MTLGAKINHASIFRPLEFDDNLLHQMDMFGQVIIVDPGAAIITCQISRMSRSLKSPFWQAVKLHRRQPSTIGQRNTLWLHDSQCSQHFWHSSFPVAACDIQFCFSLLYFMTAYECIMRHAYNVWPNQVTLIVGKLHALLASRRVFCNELVP